MGYNQKKDSDDKLVEALWCVVDMLYMRATIAERVVNRVAARSDKKQLEELMNIINDVENTLK